MTKEPPRQLARCKTFRRLESNIALLSVAPTACLMLAITVSPSLSGTCCRRFAFRMSGLLYFRAPLQMQSSAAHSSRSFSSTSFRKRISNDAPQSLARQPGSATNSALAFEPIVLQHNDRPGILRMLSAGASAQLVFWLWCAKPIPAIIFVTFAQVRQALYSAPSIAARTRRRQGPAPGVVCQPHGGQRHGRGADVQCHGVRASAHVLHTYRQENDSCYARLDRNADIDVWSFHEEAHAVAF